MGVFGRAADWLENGRPGERAAAAEAQRYGERLWSIDGTRCYQQQAPDAYRLTLVTGTATLRYEIVGVGFDGEGVAA